MKELPTLSSPTFHYLHIIKKTYKAGIDPLIRKEIVNWGMSLSFKYTMILKNKWFHVITYVFIVIVLGNVYEKAAACCSILTIEN